MSVTLYILIGVIIFIAICLAIANTATSNFERKYKKYNDMMLNTTYSAGEFAEMLISSSGYPVKIAVTDEELQDAYSSKYNALILSHQTINSYSIAGYAIVAHEFGHAVQKNSGKSSYLLLRLCKTISAIFGNFSFPLILIGLISKLILPEEIFGSILLIAGCVIFAISLFTTILTIPIEFNASNIGLEKIKEFQVLEGKEYRLAKKFLKSAGQTYVAAFLSRIFAWTFLVPKYKR